MTIVTGEMIDISRMNNLTREGSEIIKRLNILFSLEDLVSLQKIYIHMNIKFRRYTIQANKVTDGKQKKVQVYFLKKRNMTDKEYLEGIFIDCTLLCSIVTEIKLIKNIEKERSLRENLTYKNELFQLIK